MSSHKNIALIWTEFTESIMKSIMDMEGIEKLDYLFIRDVIHKNSFLKKYSEKVIVLPDVSLSIRGYLKIRKHVKKLVDNNLKNDIEYSLWLNNPHNPYGNSLINTSGCKQAYIFDEGTGSYVNWGFCNRTLGKKVFLTTAFLNLYFMLKNHSTFYFPKNKIVKTYSLFPNSFPQYDFNNQIINHKIFKNTVKNNSINFSEKFDLEDNSAIYLPSPFGDTNVLSQELDYKIARETISKFISFYPETKLIYTKIHPRCIIENEKNKSNKLSRELGIKIKVLENRINFENFLFNLNLKQNNKIFSNTSSSLFVTKALLGKEIEIASVRSKILIDNLRISKKAYNMFNNIELKVIG